VEGNLYEFIASSLVPKLVLSDSDIAAEMAFDQAFEADQAGQSELALSLYYNAAAINPTAVGAWLNIGTIEYNRGHLASAERYYCKALAADDNCALAHFSLGNVLDDLGRHQDAIVEYRRAIAINPQCAEARHNLREILKRRFKL
jgi:tetratricopeptide (TPR) repeat protein